MRGAYECSIWVERSLCLSAQTRAIHARIYPSHSQRPARSPRTLVHGTLSKSQKHRGIRHAQHGCGRRFFVAADQAEKTVAIARQCGIEVWVAGKVETGPKQVVIESISVTYESEDLKLRRLVVAALVRGADC